MKAQHPRWSASQIFAEAQRQVRWHYQWAVLTDFLPTVVGRPAMSAVFPRGAAPPRVSYYNPCAQGMPVEFSVAAYRFGHSMVRPIYRLNAAMPERLPVFASLQPGRERPRRLPAVAPGPVRRLEVLLPTWSSPAGWASRRPRTASTTRWSSP